MRANRRLANNSSAILPSPVEIALAPFDSSCEPAAKGQVWPGRTQQDEQTDKGENRIMTTDLWYLALTAGLTAALWIPYIACQVMTNGLLAPENYVDPKPRPVPLWGQRAHRAYLNAVESFAPFAALVIVANLAGKADAMTAFWAVSFFWLRLVARDRLLAGDPVHPDAGLHPGLRRGRRHLLGSDQVIAEYRRRAVISCFRFRRRGRRQAEGQFGKCGRSAGILSSAPQPANASSVIQRPRTSTAPIQGRNTARSLRPCTLWPSSPAERPAAKAP